MLEIENDILKRDKKLIILEQVFKHHEASRENRIRFNTLRRLCDKRIMSLGMGVQYGGNFVSHLDAWQGHEDEPEDRRCLRIERRPWKEGAVKNMTWIVPNIERIKDHFQSLKFTESSKDLRHVNLADASAAYERKNLTNDLMEDEWKRIIKFDIESNNSFVSRIDKFRHRKDYQFMIDSVAELASSLRPRRWSVSYLSPHDKTFRFDREEVQSLIHLTEKLHARNPFPFKFVLEYLGPLSDNQSTDLQVEWRNKQMDYFVRWARIYENHVVTHEEKGELAELWAHPEKWESEALESVKRSETARLFVKFASFFGRLCDMALRKRVLPPLDLT